MRITVVGGGIAGTTVIETLVQHDEEKQLESIVLISESRLVKQVVSHEIIGRNIDKVEVIENDVDKFLDVINTNPDITFKYICARLEAVDCDKKQLILLNHKGEVEREPYDILCICTGSRPRSIESLLKIDSLEISGRIIEIRDIESIHDLKHRLTNCNKLIIVGNGGISLELVSKVSRCHITWIVRDDSIGSTFLDSGAAKFILEHLSKSKDAEVGQISTISNHRTKKYLSTRNLDKSRFGPALGPDWMQDIDLVGNWCSDQLDIIYNDQVINICYNPDSKHPIQLETQNGKKFECDYLASAIGVDPNTLDVLGETIVRSQSGGGIIIDEQMRTSLNGVYAAGDIVSCDNWSDNKLWFQMRLWTQARQMGSYAAKCILAHNNNQDPSIYSNFDCFTHCTTFFNLKVILLGRYNGQSLDDAELKRCEVLARINPGKDYVKVLLKDGKIIGAVLLGESGLEETIENLIHDQIDVSSFKEQLLDGTVDIDDYFD